MVNSRVSIIKCDNYDSGLVFASVKSALGLLGGITNFVRPGSRVLVKPNLLMSKPPEAGITTHPEVARSVIKLLKEINCRIFVGDGPSVWGKYIENVDEVYRATGIEAVCKQEDVSLVRFDKRRMRQKFPLTAWLDETDYLINLPKFKTHGLTLLTGGIKNLFGLVSGTYKTELHKNYFKMPDFSKILVDIYQEAKPALTIVDGIIAMEGDGPGTTGKLRQAGVILAGVDCAAVDSILACIMGLRPRDILTTKEASLRGLGQADLCSIEIMGAKLEEVIGKPFLLPAASGKMLLPQPVINALKKLIKFYPFVLNKLCVKCGNCIQVCPKKCVSLEKGCIVFNYRDCIACFCCQETCPESAIKVKKSLFARIIGL